MAYIKVDYSKFANAAEKIDSHVDFANKRMQSSNGEVNNLFANWQGADYEQFKTQWDRVSDSDSTYTHMINALKSYSDYLRYVSEKYREVQSGAVSRANGLPK